MSFYRLRLAYCGLMMNATSRETFLFCLIHFYDEYCIKADHDHLLRFLDIDFFHNGSKG